MAAESIDEYEKKIEDWTLKLLDETEEEKKKTIRKLIERFETRVAELRDSPPLAPAPGFDLSSFAGKPRNRRRESLETEKSPIKEPVRVRNQLGRCLKFLNRERSTNQLLVHAQKQFEFYNNGYEEKQFQFATCSGGPGLGKTTFCRKAFTKSVDDLQNQEIWEGVSSDFKATVKKCVETGCQYRISFGDDPMLPEEGKPDNIVRSFAIRLAKQITQCNVQTYVDLDRCPSGFQLLCDVVSHITGGDSGRMVVVNLDETNRLRGKKGREYLEGVLSATKKVLERKLGFLYVILSGTNARELHRSCQVSSGLTPEEIVLALLKTVDVMWVLWDLRIRCGPLSSSSIDDIKLQLKFSLELTFVIKILGGVPRFVEILAFLIGQDEAGFFSPDRFVCNFGCDNFGKGTNPGQLLDNTKYLVLQQYGSTLASTLHTIENLPTLLAFSLFGGKGSFVVTRGMNLFGKTVEELEKEGIIFLTSQEPSPLTIPLLVLLCDLRTRNEVPAILRDFQVGLSPDENEALSLSVIRMKCDALVKSSSGPVLLRELFPIDKHKFPKLNPKWFEFTFQPPETKQIRFKNRVEKKTWTQFQESCKATGGYIWNGEKSSFCDSICLAQGGGFAIFVQDKQSQEERSKKIEAKEPTPMSIDLVQEEHRKCQVETDHLFVLITDCRFVEKYSLADNEIVLSHAEHGAMMGEYVALLRQFSNHFAFTSRQPMGKRKRD